MKAGISCTFNFVLSLGVWDGQPNNRETKHTLDISNEIDSD